MNFSSCLFSITSAWRSKHITIDHQHLGSHKDNKYTILQQNLVSAQKGLAETKVKQHQQSVEIKYDSSSLFDKYKVSRDGCDFT